MREAQEGQREAEWADDDCPEPIRAALRRPVTLGPGARARLAASLAAAAQPKSTSRLAGAGRWLVRPLRLSPLASGAIAAGLVAIGVLVGEHRARGHGPATDGAGAIARAVAIAPSPGGAPGEAARVVRFVLVAPGAARVALVGDFNAWDPTRTPMRATRSGGVWSVELPVSAGRHAYAFVVDGTRWVADPAAPLAPEDGFGSRNSVLVVGAET